MDGDLQNDPADIGDLLGRSMRATTSWSAGGTTVRTSSLAQDPLADRQPLIAKVTGVPIRDNGCSLKAYRAG